MVLTMPILRTTTSVSGKSTKQLSLQISSASIVSALLQYNSLGTPTIGTPTRLCPISLSSRNPSFTGSRDMVLVTYVGSPQCTSDSEFFRQLQSRPELQYECLARWVTTQLKVTLRSYGRDRRKDRQPTVATTLFTILARVLRQANAYKTLQCSAQYMLSPP